MILVDTQALVWWSANRRHLSAKATRELHRAESILVSTATFFEIASLARRGKFRLDLGVFDWIRELFADERFKEAPLTWTAAASAGSLGDAFPGDPADRLIFATARELAVPLVTSDRRIYEFARESRDVKVIW